MEDPAGSADPAGGAEGKPPHGGREELYLDIQNDGQRLAAGLIRLLHAMSDGSGLNPSDFQCYALLKVGGPMTPGEIARDLRLTTGSVTGVVDRLEARGLVVRDRHPEDRRKVVVRPAVGAERPPVPGGTGIREAMTALHDRYSVGELEVIADWLSRIGATLDALAGRSVPPEPGPGG
ncbi:MarR family winged helix-turn-helix transcriptional regulator [Nocardiopsis baichengensis]|uniref:MarR family winged helix-turn-helix transcriptional regulator n=1 Tax=Nocardiopsis baichengensis TaxID=280240 RepID=UPI00034B3B94|nr:MarR family transcriptional regulator [Nocardiopsis baichengensis]